MAASISSWGALEPLVSAKEFQTQLSTDTSILIYGGSSIDANELAAKFLYSDSGVIYVAFDTSIDSTLRGWWLDVLAATDAIIEPEFAIVEATDSKRQLTIKQVESDGSAAGMYRYQYTYRDINGKRIYERTDPSNYSISIAESAYTHASSFANSQEAGWKHVAFHELGHALGLEHPHDWSDGDGDNEINTNNTVMSYETVVSDDGNPQFEQLDQAALIEIHGKETGLKSTPISGSKLVTDLGPRTINKTWKGGALSVSFSTGAYISEPSSGLTKTQLLIKREDANIENSIKVNLIWKFGDNLNWYYPTGYQVGWHDILMDSPWQVEFAANQETIAVDLWIVGDTKKEANEWIEVTVDGAYNFSSWPTLPTRLTITEEPVSLKSTYTLTSSAATISEGAVLTNTVTTTNVVSGTKLYYSLSGAGITTADFSAGALTGEGITDSAGKFTFTRSIVNDLTTEGAESLVIKLYSDSARTLQVGATAAVNVVDSSTTPAPTHTVTPSASSINEGSTLTTSVATTNVALGTTLYYSLSGTGITTSDFASGALTGSGSVASNGSFSFSHTLANDLITEGTETLEIKLFSDSDRTVQVGSTASVSIVDKSLGLVLTYYNSNTNKTLNAWNIYQVTNSVKAGDIVSQWFGTAAPTAQRIQDVSDKKLIDVVANTWSDRVQINRVAKATDAGGKIEAKQIDFGSGEVVGSVVSGGIGNDIITGYAGWDILDGGLGNDLIHGGNGRDIISGGAGRDELHGDFGWNTYRSEKDGVSDLIAIKSDHYLVNWLYGKAGNSPNGEKSDIIEGLDAIDKIRIIGIDTREITFAANISAKGVTGIGIYGKGILEALYTGGDLTVAQITQMTSGDASAAAMSNSVNSYGVW